MILTEKYYVYLNQKILKYEKHQMDVPIHNSNGMLNTWSINNRAGPIPW